MHRNEAAEEGRVVERAVLDMVAVAFEGRHAARRTAVTAGEDGVDVGEFGLHLLEVEHVEVRQPNLLALPHRIVDPGAVMDPPLDATVHVDRRGEVAAEGRFRGGVAAEVAAAEDIVRAGSQGAEEGEPNGVAFLFLLRQHFVLPQMPTGEAPRFRSVVGLRADGWPGREVTAGEPTIRGRNELGDAEANFGEARRFVGQVRQKRWGARVSAVNRRVENHDLIDVEGDEPVGGGGDGFGPTEIFNLTSRRKRPHLGRITLRLVRIPRRIRRENLKLDRRQMRRRVSLHRRNHLRILDEQHELRDARAPLIRPQPTANDLRRSQNRRHHHHPLQRLSRGGWPGPAGPRKQRQIEPIHLAGVGLFGGAEQGIEHIAHHVLKLSSRRCDKRTAFRARRASTCNSMRRIRWIGNRGGRRFGRGRCARIGW